jgi:hypothetical protein
LQKLQPATVGSVRKVIEAGCFQIFLKKVGLNPTPILAHVLYLQHVCSGQAAPQGYKYRRLLQELIKSLSDFLWKFIWECEFM